MAPFQLSRRIAGSPEKGGQPIAEGASPRSAAKSPLSPVKGERTNSDPLCLRQIPRIKLNAMPLERVGRAVLDSPSASPTNGLERTNGRSRPQSPPRSEATKRSHSLPAPPDTHPLKSQIQKSQIPLASLLPPQRATLAPAQRQRPGFASAKSIKALKGRPNNFAFPSPRFALSQIWGIIIGRGTANARGHHTCSHLFACHSSFIPPGSHDL